MGGGQDAGQALMFGGRSIVMASLESILTIVAESQVTDWERISHSYRAPDSFLFREDVDLRIEERPDLVDALLEGGPWSAEFGGVNPESCAFDVVFRSTSVQQVLLASVDGRKSIVSMPRNVKGEDGKVVLRRPTEFERAVARIVSPGPQTYLSLLRSTD